MKIILRILIIVGGIAALLYVINLVETESNQNHAAETRSTPIAVEMPLMQLLDSLEVNPHFVHEGQMIQTQAVLLSIQPSGGRYALQATGIRTTDSATWVARTIDYQKIEKKAEKTPCDSSILKARDWYKIREYPHKIELIADVVNDLDDKMRHPIYNRDCPPYIVTVTKRKNFQLEYFCYEKVTIKGEIYSVKRRETDWEIILSDAVLVEKVEF